MVVVVTTLGPADKMAASLAAFGVVVGYQFRYTILAPSRSPACGSFLALSRSSSIFLLSLTLSLLMYIFGSPISIFLATFLSSQLCNHPPYQGHHHILLLVVWRGGGVGDRQKTGKLCSLFYKLVGKCSTCKFRIFADASKKTWFLQSDKAAKSAGLSPKDPVGDVLAHLCCRMIFISLLTPSPTLGKRKRVPLYVLLTIVVKILGCADFYGRWAAISTCSSLLQHPVLIC